SIRITNSKNNRKTKRGCPISDSLFHIPTFLKKSARLKLRDLQIFCRVDTEIYCWFCKPNETLSSVGGHPLLSICFHYSNSFRKDSRSKGLVNITIVPSSLYCHCSLGLSQYNSTPFPSGS